MQIMVMCGGDSAERVVSLCSGARVAQALTEAGCSVECIDFRGESLDQALIARLRASDAVFLTLHGGIGEDGGLQLLLEQAGIFHYTGSAPSGAALAMDKQAAKQRVAAVGVPVAANVALQASVPVFPFLLKPRWGGSSVGLRVIESAQELAAVRCLPQAEQDVLLCEQYLPGREFTVGILDGCALPVVEICVQDGMYDYAHKYTVGACRELCPAPIAAAKTARLHALALTAFRALGLRDYARVDFREDAQGEPCFLEANTLPGMTPTSLFPLACATAGIAFPTLCKQMAAMAAKRKV